MHGWPKVSKQDILEYVAGRYLPIETITALKMQSLRGKFGSQQRQATMIGGR